MIPGEKKVEYFLATHRVIKIILDQFITFTDKRFKKKSIKYLHILLHTLALPAGIRKRQNTHIYIRTYTHMHMHKNGIRVLF